MITKYLKEFDQWLDSKLPNGMNHAVYAASIILTAYILGGFYWALGFYIGAVVFFYLSEVKQAVDTQSWTYREAFKFWKWQTSKIQDVAYVALLGVFLWIR